MFALFLIFLIKVSFDIGEGFSYESVLPSVITISKSTSCWKSISVFERVWWSPSFFGWEFCRLGCWVRLYSGLGRGTELLISCIELWCDSPFTELFFDKLANSWIVGSLGLLWFDFAFLLSLLKVSAGLLYFLIISITLSIILALFEGLLSVFAILEA